MRIFLLWDRTSRRGKALTPESVQASLQKVFAPLCKTQFRVTVRNTELASLVLFEQKVSNWKLPFFEEDDRSWALAIDYPLDGRLSLPAKPDSEALLLPLCEALQNHPRELLRQMSPPFSLIWTDKRTGETFSQNDGLGLAQLLEFRKDEFWVQTNKIFALKALNVALEPQPEEWAVRSTLGWFPMTMTGYKDIRLVEPGTQSHISRTGLKHVTHDVLSDWVLPQGLRQKDCVELGRCSVVAHLNAVMPLCDKPFVGLTGGWDSRAIIATLRLLGYDFQARVKGKDVAADVLIATELARIADIDLEVRRFAELPSNDPDDWRRSIRLALLWQAGYREAEFHKTFLTKGKFLGAGRVCIMGKHGEIARGYYYPSVEANPELDDDQIEKALMKQLLKRMPPFIRNDLRGFVGDTIRKAYQQANHYGLSGLARLDFFYLFERTRRNTSGTLNAHTGLVVAPFMNPDYIRAAFAYAGREKSDNIFPRHIISTNAPDWADVCHSRELKHSESFKPNTTRTPASPAEAHLAKFRKSRYYDNLDSWKTVGTPLITEALKQAGFWQEVFDPETTKRDWIAAPDELSMTQLLQSIL